MLKRTFALLLVLLSLSLLLTGCGKQANKNIDIPTAKQQLDDYITEIRSNGAFDAIVDYWNAEPENPSAFPFENLPGQNGTLRIAVTHEKPFIFSENGGICGISAQLLYEFCEKYGYRGTVQDYTGTANVVVAVSSGKADVGICSISITEERKQSVDFSVPYFDNEIVAFTKTENLEKYKTLESLAGQRIGCQSGSVCVTYIQQHYGIQCVVEFNNLSDMSYALDTGKIDLAVTDVAVLGPIFHRFPNFSQAVTLIADDHFGVVWSKTDSSDNSISSAFQRTFVESNRWKDFLTGLRITIYIALASILLGTLLGFGIFLLCRKGGKISNSIAKGFYWVVEGFPAVVFLMIFYYIIFGNTHWSSAAISVIALSILFSSNIFTSLKTSVDAIDPGQYEVSYALGYSNSQAFFRMILPQAASIFWPQYLTHVQAQIKATAIVGYIAAQDLTKICDVIRAATYEPLLPLLAISIIYFLLILIVVKGIGLIINWTKPSKARSNRYLKGVNRHD